MRRVVVTGIGVVSPLGCKLDVFWQGLVEGKSGIRKITKFDASDCTSRIAGEVVDFNADEFVSKKEKQKMDEFCIYAIAAAKMAVADAGMDFSKENPDLCGAMVGSGIGGLQTLEIQHSILKEKGPSRCSPYMIPQMISNMAAGLVAIEFNLRGPNACVVTACASAAHSIGYAMRDIQRGDADVMVAGGAEACVCKLGIAGFCALKALCANRNDEPEKASRPFDLNRSGFIMGDGAALLILEEYEHAKKRNARIYCELSGFGMTCDAFHMTAPADDGNGAARAMTAAMRDAKVDPSRITYINAHGTSTSLNDKIETRAIKLALGEQNARKVMISSTKSMTGHTLGAAAAIESAALAMSIYKGVVHPTINQETPDPECDLDYVPNVAREVKIDAVLKNSLGFGGHNACLLYNKI